MQGSSGRPAASGDARGGARACLALASATAGARRGDVSMPRSAGCAVSSGATGTLVDRWIASVRRPWLEGLLEEDPEPGAAVTRRLLPAISSGETKRAVGSALCCTRAGSSQAGSSRQQPRGDERSRSSGEGAECGRARGTRGEACCSAPWAQRAGPHHRERDRPLRRGSQRDLARRTGGRGRPHRAARRAGTSWRGTGWPFKRRVEDEGARDARRARALLECARLCAARVAL
jgi:hypothetical protein